MNTPRLILATSITAFLALSAAPSVQAATQYWNPGGTGTITTVTAGSGAWDTTTPNWTDATTATTAGATFVNTNSAVFAGTGATPSTSVNTNAGADAAAESLVVTLGSAITTGTSGLGIFFNNTGFLLTSPTAQTITDGGNITIAAGKSASIGGSLTLDLINGSSSPSVTLGTGSVFNINTGATLTKASAAGSFTRGLILTGSGTVNIAGTVSYNIVGGTSGGVTIGNTGGTVIANVNNGGLLTSNSAGVSGTGSIVVDNAGSATATLNVNAGGNVSATNTTSAFAGIQLGRVSGGSGTVNLNGGTITTPRVYKGTVTGTFNFNGGTLKANVTNTTDFMTGLTRANVRDGGAVIDTATFDITIGQALLPSNVAGLNPNTAAVDAGTGGLTKNNAGILALGGANTYNGATTINGGTLSVNGSNSGTGAFTVAAAAGATLAGTGTITNTTGVIVTGGIDGSVSGTLRGGTTAAATGALTIGGNVTLQDNTTIALTLAASGVHSTLTRTAGTWVFDSDQAFSFTDLGATAGFYDNIITGLTGNEAGLSTINTFTIRNTDFIGTFTYDAALGSAGNVDFNLMAVPEPGSAALLLSGIGLLALRRKRRAACVLTAALALRFEAIGGP